MNAGVAATLGDPANGAFFPVLPQEANLYRRNWKGDGRLARTQPVPDRAPPRQRRVAVKAIEQRGEAGRRVLREAQAAARLNHPGIVTLYELGEEDGNALLVTELVEGSTLARLSAAGELSDREVAEIGADLCEALDHAHSRGVVHRDIKPQNVQVTDSEPRAKVMDVGIARLADEAALTAAGDVVGTLAYMSPEQAEGREAG